MGEEYWVGALSATILSNSIECMPGNSRAKLNSHRVTLLVGIAPSKVAAVAAPGSLKRAAIEAEERANQPYKRLRIDLGMKLPTTKIPTLIRDGFTKLDRQFLKGNQAIREHYAVALHCLADCLEDFRCEVLLMLALTLSSCSVTPQVKSGAQHFEAGATKDPAMFAANLVTRMLWFLRPEWFPWEQDKGGVLCVNEMTKKIGKPVPFIASAHLLITRYIQSTKALPIVSY